MEKMCQIKKMSFKLMEKNIFFSPPTAFLFNILYTHINENKNVLPWIISNFINIFADLNIPIPDKEYTIVYQDFFRQDLWYSCPFLSTIDFKEDYIEKKYTSKRFVNLVKDAIDLDYYVYAVLNRYYIPNYKFKEDSKHNLLIYGYNDFQQKLSIADYFRQNTFSLEECSYQNINDAYNHLAKIGDYKEHFYVNIFKFKECNYYTFNISEIKHKLIDYIESTNLLEKYHFSLFADQYRNSGNMYYGISYYDALIQMIESELSFSPRDIHILVTQKTLMKNQIQYLIENNYIYTSDLTKDITILLEETLLLRNNIIKIILRNKSDIITDQNVKSILINKIKYLKQKDYEYVKKLISLL